MAGRVLIVDDDPVFVAFARMALEDMAPDGTVVAEAHRVSEAVPILRQWAADGAPALVLTDYNMPGGTGLDLISNAKAAFAEAPFCYVCITSIEHRAVLARVERHGAATAVKPRDPESLLALLRQTLSQWLSTVTPIAHAGAETRATASWPAPSL